MLRSCCTVASLVLSGCGWFTQPPYLLDELTVVAMVAQPPHLAPGAEARVTAIVVDPQWSEAAPSVTWGVCSERGQRGNAARCDAPLHLDAAPPSRLGPGVYLAETTHVISPSELDGTPEIVQLTGFWEHVRVHVAGAATSREAFKRLVVTSLLAEVNTNPVLHGGELRLHGEVLTEARAPTGSTLELLPLFDAESLERYVVPNIRQELEEHVETPSFTWYVTAGALDRWMTEEASPPVHWTLPDSDEAPSSALLFLVMRDGRGGAAYWFTEVALD